MQLTNCCNYANAKDFRDSGYHNSLKSIRRNVPTPKFPETKKVARPTITVGSLLSVVQLRFPG